MRREREKNEEYLRGLENERQRIGRELHDDVAGELVGLLWKLHDSKPEDLKKDIQHVAKRVRGLAHEMMPVEFHEMSFTTLLTDYIASVNATANQNRIRLSKEGTFPWDDLPTETSHELFRIIQESVRNAITHGLPGDINVRLMGDKTFSLSVSNPFDASKEASENSGKGHDSLRSRASIIGANLEINSTDGVYTITINSIQPPTA